MKWFNYIPVLCVAMFFSCKDSELITGFNNTNDPRSDSYILSVPQNFQIKDMGDASVCFTWNYNYNVRSITDKKIEDLKFILEKSDGDSGNYIPVDTIGSGENSRITINSLNSAYGSFQHVCKANLNFQKYEFRIRAIHNNKVSGYSLPAAGVLYFFSPEVSTSSGASSSDVFDIGFSLYGNKNENKGPSKWNAARGIKIYVKYEGEDNSGYREVGDQKIKFENYYCVWLYIDMKKFVEKGKRLNIGWCAYTDNYMTNISTLNWVYSY